MTPDNASFMVAGYIAAAIVYIGYTLITLRRRREMARRWREVPAPVAPPPVSPRPDAAA